MTATTNRFVKGSGCYTCNSCGIKTRSTGQGDNEHCKLCVNCYDMAGFDNMVSDNGKESLTEAMISDIKAMFKTYEEKELSVSFDNLEFLRQPSLPVYLVMVTGPEAEYLIAVDAPRASKARRAAKELAKLDGLDISTLKFNARKD